MTENTQDNKVTWQEYNRTWHGTRTPVEAQEVDEDYKLKVFANDRFEHAPYEDGDYALLAEVASWLLRAYDDARQQWAIGEQECTIDALLQALHKMRFNPVELVEFRRLLKQADKAVRSIQEDAQTVRDKAAELEATSAVTRPVASPPAIPTPQPPAA